jgi:predicted dehydrogenase
MCEGVREESAMAESQRGSEVKVKIAQAGVGSHGRTIRTAIGKSRNLRLAACYDINREEARKVSEEFGCRVANSFEELIDDPDVVGVALITPNHLHHSQVLAALERGKHVFVEKPISTTVREGMEMVKRAKERGLTLQVGHNTRKKRAIRKAKSFIGEGRLGKLVSVEANVSYNAGLTTAYPRWKVERDKCPLLPMTQLGIHFIDAFHYLIGSISRVHCFARHAAMSEEVFDSTAALMEFESGVLGTMSSHYVTPGVFEIRISGTEGVVTMFNESLRLEIDKGGKQSRERFDFSDEGYESFVLEMEEFGDCILNRTTPETDGVVGLQALAVIEAMTVSVESGRVVKISEILNPSFTP